MFFKNKKKVMFLSLILLFVFTLSACSNVTSDIGEIQDRQNDIVEMAKDLEVESDKRIEDMDKLTDEINSVLDGNIDSKKDNVEEYPVKEPVKDMVNKDTDTSSSGDLEVHFLDVGQADASFLVSGGKTMLIDAGENKTAKDIEKYIKGLGYDRLDYVVATHPHADHIGGMAYILDNFEVGTMYLPNIDHTSKTYRNMVFSISENNVNTVVPNVNDTFDFAGSRVTFLSPIKDKTYNNLNNYSIVLRIDNRANSFLFTGDAEKEVEEEMLANGVNLKANVLKVGHHGSSTSSSDEFLKRVKPDLTIIQVGSGNKYGHPHSFIVDRLSNYASRILRTDEEGTIIVKSNGEEISVNK